MTYIRLRHIILFLLMAVFVTPIRASIHTDYLLGGALTLKNGRIDKYQFDEGYCQAEKYPYNTRQDNFTFCYYDKDHLGNIRQVKEADGTKEGWLLQTMDYYPFGAQFCDGTTDSNVQSRKYNGKELDEIGGLDWLHYGARMMEPEWGRFTTPDPMAEKYYDTSLYAYCANNPLNNNDPDGNQIIPVSYSSVNQQGHAIGKRYYSFVNFKKAMDSFAKSSYGERIIGAFLKKGTSQYGIKGTGEFANHVLKLKQFNFKDNNSMFLYTGGADGFFLCPSEENGHLVFEFTFDASLTINELIVTLTHELCLHGTKIEELIKAYKKGGIDAVLKIWGKDPSGDEEHRSLGLEENLPPGAYNYHKTRDQLCGANQDLIERFENDIFNSKSK